MIESYINVQTNEARWIKIVIKYIWIDTFMSSRSGGRRSPAVACRASDHWVASSNPLRGKFRH